MDAERLEGLFDDVLANIFRAHGSSPS